MRKEEFIAKMQSIASRIRNANLLELDEMAEKEAEILWHSLGDGFEMTPPDWVPPQFVRLWDSLDPQGRIVMREALYHMVMEKNE